MTALLALAVLLAPGADVAVHLAPDQPIPVVFTGDPLILELTADEDVIARVRVEVSGPGGTHAADLGALTLRAGGTLWEPVPGLPALHGRYEAAVTIATTPPVTRTAHFCRVPRPLNLEPLPATAAFPGGQIPEPAAYALSIAGLAAVQVALDPAVPDGVSTADGAPGANADHGKQVTVRVAASALHGAPPEKGTENLPARMHRWDVVDDDPAAARALLGAWSSGAPEKPVALWATDARQLMPLATPATRRVVAGWGCEGDAPAPEDLAVFRRWLEAAGVEQPPVLARIGAPATPEALVRAMVRAWGWGAAEVVVPGPMVAGGHDAEPDGDALVLVAALAHRLRPVDPAGFFPGDGAEAWVFRDAGAWRIAYWGDDPFELPVDDNVQLSDWTDAFGNPLELPAPDDGVLTLESGDAPRYVAGRLGGVLARAAANAARAEAERFVTDAALRGAMPAELVALLESVADSGAFDVSRDDFFALVRAFPYLERSWHAGDMPREAAVPAMGSLSRLVRHLAVVEEGKGETFLEPLQETLARCRQTSSLYLTQSAGTEAARLRGDWLLAEVNRLVSEAERLDAQDRAIEAKAVAALAEWRAASLRYAAEARVEAPPAASVPPPLPPPVPEDEAPGPAGDAIDEQAPNEADDAADAGPLADDGAVTPDTDTDPETANGDGEEDPAGESEPAPPDPVRTTFRVERNEGAWTIARKHGVAFADLLAWNGWSERETLREGQEYVVYLPPGHAEEPADAPADPEPERRVLRVERGESLYSLSRRHGVTMDQMREWNGWGRNPTLRVGQEYVVYTRDSG